MFMRLEVWFAHPGTGLGPPVKYFNDRSKAALLLLIIYVISVLFLLCFHVCLFIDALWSPAGKGLTSWLSFVMSILGQVWCLIVLIPDLCPISYFSTHFKYCQVKTHVQTACESHDLNMDFRLFDDNF